MAGVIGKPHATATHSSAVQAHVAHLRHLSKSVSCRTLLMTSFGMSRDDAETTGRTIAAHIAQALEFNAAASGVGFRVKPLLQYYSYLNLAVAVILAYRPQGYQDYRFHGVTDRTANFDSLALSSKVLRVGRRGTVTLFHSAISAAQLPTDPPLRDLVIPIPMLSSELADAFGMEVTQIEVEEDLAESGDDTGKHLSSRVQFRVKHPSGIALNTVRFPRQQVESAMPMLLTECAYAHGDSSLAVYQGRVQWPISQRTEALRTHRDMCRRLVNFGGHAAYNGFAQYRWLFFRARPILPTLTASLMFSFFLASVFRYRPRLASKLESSRLNLLVDTFVNEADGFLIPAFRNLLYREELTVKSMLEA
jgi:hypothetical protein